MKKVLLSESVSIKPIWILQEMRLDSLHLFWLMRTNFKISLKFEVSPKNNSSVIDINRFFTLNTLKANDDFFVYPVYLENYLRKHPDTNADTSQNRNS